VLIIENLVERKKIEAFKKRILEIMSYSDFSRMTIEKLIIFKGLRSDPNLVKKAIISLREERLIASLPGTSESQLEEEIIYGLTQQGRDQGKAIQREKPRTIASRERYEKNTRILKEERDRDRNKAIKACGVIVAIIVIFAVFLLILGSGS